MSKFYKCKHFRIEELVTPEIFQKYGHLAWQFFDGDLLRDLDLLRDRFGTITINDWVWGGVYRDSGLRNFDYKGIFNRSLHKHGKAFDLKFADHNPHYVRTLILNKPHMYKSITTIENNTPTWLHIDSRNIDNNDGIFTFNP